VLPEPARDHSGHLPQRRVDAQGRRGSARGAVDWLRLGGHRRAEPLLAAARDAAFANAQEKAQQFGRLSGRRLGTVLRVAEDSRLEVYPRAAKSVNLAATAAVPIQAGENELEARIRVTWQLTD
jgi:hypothetical protein